MVTKIDIFFTLQFLCWLSFCFGENGSRTQTSIGLLSQNEEVPDPGDCSDFILSSGSDSNVTMFFVKNENSYKENMIYVCSVRVDANALGIELTLHRMDIDPQIDVLAIYNQTDADALKVAPQFIATGRLTTSKKMRLLSTGMTVAFFANSKTVDKFKGFTLTYKAFGEIFVPTLPPATTTMIPMKEVRTITKLIVVQASDQKDATWEKFRTYLCNATNRLLVEHKLSLEMCAPTNVTFVPINNCPKSFPDAENCVSMSFAVLLYNKTDKRGAEEFQEIRQPAGLTALQLETMWKRYGKSTFENFGFTEYDLPNSKNYIFFLVGVVSGIFILLLLLLFICRYIQNTHIMGDDNDQKAIVDNQNDYDITMFPSPNQVVPNFFPNNYTNSYINANLYDVRPRKPIDTPLPEGIPDDYSMEEHTINGFR